MYTLVLYILWAQVCSVAQDLWVTNRWPMDTLILWAQVCSIAQDLIGDLGILWYFICSEHIHVCAVYLALDLWVTNRLPILYLDILVTNG